MEECYYLNKGIRTYYRRNEFKKRKTIVFIHGLSGSSSAWMPYEKVFEKKYNLLSMDLRGHGKSSKPKGHKNYRIHKFSEDIYNLLKHEKIADCIIVSHSFGSIILLDFLKRHSNMVSSVILISATHMPSKRAISKIINPFFHLGEIFPLQKNKNHVDYGNYRNTGDWNPRRMYADVTNTGLHSYLNSLRHLHEFDGEKILKNLNVPVLMIHGNKDSIFLLEHAKDMRSLIKNSELKVIDGANHIIVLNNIKKLSKMIEDFVERY